MFLKNIREMRFDNLYNSDCLQIDMILLMF
uniref:Uncharacterized protein n=1 Tax=Anguilla anguilla TaxID=7936 RepID=A0A0E9PML9_ANGAN